MMETTQSDQTPTNQKPRRSRRDYTDDFKRQIVELYNSGHRWVDLEKEYELNRSTLDAWIHRFNNSGSFSAKDNRTAEENRLILLEKENPTTKPTKTENIPNKVMREKRATCVLFSE